MYRHISYAINALSAFSFPLVAEITFSLNTLDKSFCDIFPSELLISSMAHLHNVLKVVFSSGKYCLYSFNTPLSHPQKAVSLSWLVLVSWPKKSFLLKSK